ncbi:MAG: hypothetical protein GW861_14290 [Deltaproteobacteria bacterium]|nr:hypothetical protein [Deltaproteobacteria bacterium]
MLAVDRLLQIETLFAAHAARMVVIELDEELLRLVLYFEDGSNLRVTEQWNEDALERYSYYWLTAENELKIGWDNAPHHTHLQNFPHHKHVGEQADMQPSFETTLEDVMQAIIKPY